MRSLLISLLLVNISAHAAELFTCQFVNGGTVTLSADGNKEKTGTLTLSPDAQQALNAAESELKQIPVLITAQERRVPGRRSPLLYPGDLDTGSQVYGPGCALEIKFTALGSNPAQPIPAGAPVQLTDSAGTALYCSHDRSLKIATASCVAAPELGSLANLLRVFNTTPED